MGADFSHNPVAAVQGGQLELITRAPSQRLRVLDLGCEAGTPTQILMSDASHYHVIGADLSLQALARYVDDTQRSGIQLDALRLPFADGSFDIVVSDDVIEHLVDTDSYTREISRVLSPNG
jgi:SAM-dependent methyltransferase